MILNNDATLSKPGTGWKNNSLFIAKGQDDLEGVYSIADIEQGDLIEVCPLIIFTPQDVGLLQYTNLYHYYSFTNERAYPGFLPLGFGAVYNHASPANGYYEIDLEEKTLTIRAQVLIKHHTEIRISYNGVFNDNTPVSFPSKNEVYEFTINFF